MRSPGGYPGEDVDVLFDFIFSGDPAKRDYCIETVRDEMEANLDRATGDYNDFWAERDYLNHIDGVRAATLMSHGFNDWNVMPEHSYRISQALKERGVPVQIYYHQGGHGGPAAPDDDEPLVHALPAGRRERRRERPQGVDRAGAAHPKGPRPRPHPPARTHPLSGLPAP